MNRTSSRPGNARLRSPRSIGFDSSEQTRIATAVSEIVRNAFRYAGNGVVEVSIEGQTLPQVLIIKVADTGRGIPNLDDVLAGRYRSTTGMGIGLIGTRRLMDQFDISSSPAGTIVTLKKLLPRRAPFLGPTGIAEPAEKVHTHRPGGLVEEIQQQNQELLRTLDELKSRQEDLVGSTASSKTPTAASSRSTPSSTSAPTTCGAPTS